MNLVSESNLNIPKVSSNLSVSIEGIGNLKRSGTIGELEKAQQNGTPRENAEKHLFPLNLFRLSIMHLEKLDQSNSDSEVKMLGSFLKSGKVHHPQLSSLSIKSRRISSQASMLDLTPAKKSISTSRLRKALYGTQVNNRVKLSSKKKLSSLMHGKQKRIDKQMDQNEKFVLLPNSRIMRWLHGVIGIFILIYVFRDASMYSAYFHLTIPLFLQLDALLLFIFPLMCFCSKFSQAGWHLG